MEEKARQQQLCAGGGASIRVVRSWLRTERTDRMRPAELLAEVAAGRLRVVPALVGRCGAPGKLCGRGQCGRRGRDHLLHGVWSPSLALLTALAAALLPVPCRLQVRFTHIAPCALTCRVMIHSRSFPSLPLC